jgi:hypothetical protein
MAELIQCDRDHARIITVTTEPDSQTVELRLSYRYAKEHPWVVQAVTGFLSAYFMEQPSFRVQRHFDELESGMHVWLCDVPATMKMGLLMRRLQADLPPFQSSQSGQESGRPQYVIDSMDKS